MLFRSEKWLDEFYFGRTEPGLKQLVSQEHLDTIEMSVVNAIPIGRDTDGNEISVRVWRNGESLHRGEIEKCTMPDGVLPDELTVERLHRAEAQIPLGHEFAEREVPVVGALQERGDRGGLVDRVGPGVVGLVDERVVVEAGEVEPGGLRQMFVDDVVVLFTVVEVELVVVESGFGKLKMGVRSFSDCASGSFLPSHTYTYCPDSTRSGK